MIYKLTKKRTFSLDNEDQRMLLMDVGDGVKIEGANVYIQEPDTKEWHLTIDMVTNFLMRDLAETYTE